MIHVAYSGLGGHGAVLFSLLNNQFLPQFSHVVLFVGVEPPREDYIKACERLGIEHAYVARRPRSSYLGFALEIFRYLRRLKPDAIFAHGLAAVPAISLFRAMSSGKETLLLRETQANHLKTLKDWMFLALANVMFSRIAYLTQDALHGARKVLGWFFYESKSTVIANGLDLQTFHCARRKMPREGALIGMQSRFQDNKDHGVLVEAFSRVVAQGPELRPTLHLAGDGETLARIKVIVEALGISERVTFHGLLGQQELPGFLASLDLYVHCTHGETMSTAIMQALACGLPVVASDVPGVSNMIGAGHGLLYKPGSVEDLASKILTVLRDADLAAQLSKAARAYAEKEFDASQLVEKYSHCFV